MATESLYELFSATWRDQVIVFAVATWSGIVTSLHRTLSHRRRFSLAALLTDVLLSGLAGMLIYWVFGSLHIEATMLTAAVAGLAGHSAPRTLWLLERLLNKRLGLEERDAPAPDRTEDRP